MRSTLVAAALSGGILAGASARADVIEFTFRGRIDSIGGAVPAPVQIGDDYEFRYRFDSTAVDADPAPNVGNYEGAIFRAWVTIGTYSTQQNAPADIFVLNDGFAGDSYSANVFGPITSTILNMTNLGGAAFNSDALPSDLVLSQWQIRSFSFQQDVGPAFWSAEGSVTDFESRIVPAPGVGMLGLVCGFAVLPRRRC
ncbi:MAG: hypothetical protein Kow0022_04180 [Phycisphaerales bacterium]